MIGVQGTGVKGARHREAGGLVSVGQGRERNFNGRSAFYSID